MKRTSAILLVLALCLSMTLLAACGGSKADPDKIMKDLLAEAQPTIAAMSTSLGDTMGIAVSSRGHAFVYTFTYKTDLGVDNSLLAPELEAQTVAQDATYKTVVESLKTQGIKDGSVIIEYLDYTGVVIYSKEYK